MSTKSQTVIYLFFSCSRFSWVCVVVVVVVEDVYVCVCVSELSDSWHLLKLISKTNPKTLVPLL